MTTTSRWARRGLLLSALALPAASGCNGSGTLDRGGPGTNASTGEVTTGGPGSPVVGKDVSPAPESSAPYGGGGPGVSPPVTPAKGAPPSGDSNSGQSINKYQGPGADADAGAAKATPGASGPGAGTPPR